MIWMCKENGYLYELLIKSLNEESFDGCHPVACIYFMGEEPHKPEDMLQRNLGEYFEFIGWL